MKIVFVDTTLSGELIGGAQTFLPKIISGLHTQGAEVSLVTNGPPHPKVKPALEKSGAAVYSDLYNPKSLVEDSSPVLARWLNEKAPDIYVISVSPDIGWTVLPLLNPKTATLTIGHTDSETFYAPARHYRQFISRAVGVSREVCENFINSCRLEKSRVRWIPYGVETATELSKNDSPAVRLCYVGRLEEEQKRVSDLIKIIKRLGEQNVSFRFDVIGDGESMSKFKSDLQEEIKSGSVKLHGWLEEKSLLEKLREAEIFLLTSAYEGFCISLVEAMANGCCPIVTDINSGNKQLIENGRNGFLFPIGDTASFSKKISVLAREREKLWSLRQKAWETGKDYSVGRMVQSYLKLFEEAAREAKDNPRSEADDFPLMPSCRSKYPLWLRRLKASICQ